MDYNETMKITMIQIKVSKDIRRNIFQFKQEALRQKQADMIVLGEMWNTPYDNETMKASVQYERETIDAMKEVSKTLHNWIVGGSICTRQGQNYYNTCFVFHDGQIVCSYQKTHLMAFHGRENYNEADLFTPGNRLITFRTPWAKMGIVICYDIRFPELARLLAMHQIKVLFVPGAFNESAGKAHWKPVLQTRAMENQIFVVGCSPAKYSYKSYTSYGHSMIADPFGRILYEMTEDEKSCCVDIDLYQLEIIRKRMPFWQLRRTDLYNIEEMTDEKNIDP